MSDRRMTVHEVADLTGITIRTLHYYDKIGLLKPTMVTDSKYRLYTDDDLSFKITKGRIFLIKSENKNKLYRKLKTINLEEEIIIIPDYYKAYNLTY